MESSNFIFLQIVLYPSSMGNFIWHTSDSSKILREKKNSMGKNSMEYLLKYSVQEFYFKFMHKSSFKFQVFGIDTHKFTRSWAGSISGICVCLV